MKVLFIAPFDLTLRDGTSIRVSNIARATARICKDVFLLSYTINEELKTLSNLVHIKMKTIQVRQHFIIAFTDIINPQLAFKLASRFLESSFTMMKGAIEDVDVIYTHWLLFSYLAKSLRLLVNQHIPVVVDLHGLFRLQKPPKHSMRDILAYTLGLIHETIIIKNKFIKAFTVPSKRFREFLKEAYTLDPSRVFEVPDVVDPEVIESARKCKEFDEEIRKFLGECPELRDTVAYIGTISTYHGFFDLIKAIKIAKKIAKRDFKLLLIIPDFKQLVKFSALLPKNTIILENIHSREYP